MIVKLKTRYAGPLGNYGPGAEIKVSDFEGKALIDAGAATEVAKPKPEPKKEPEEKAEKAEAGPEETATAPPTRRRKTAAK